MRAVFKTKRAGSTCNFGTKNRSVHVIRSGAVVVKITKVAGFTVAAEKPGERGTNVGPMKVPSAAATTMRAAESGH